MTLLHHKSLYVHILHILIEERDAIVRQFSYGTEEEKAILIRRYGRQMLEAYSADRFTQEWLEKNSKKCPNCNTPIQVTLLLSYIQLTKKA